MLMEKFLTYSMKVTQPLNGYLLIKPKPTAEAIPGIEIPDSVDKEKATVGTIVLSNYIKKSCIADTSVKPNTNIMVWLMPDVGSTVIFNAFAPRKVTHEGEECLLVQCEDIYAVIEA